MEAAIAFAAWWSVILAMIGVAALAGVNVRPGWVAAAIVLQLIYFASNVFGGQLLSLESYFGDLNWNWDGKIVATLTTLIVFVVLAVTTRAVSFQSAGFVLRQKQGSVVPALIAILSLTLLVIGLEIAVNDGRDLDGERLLFQATMPGLDEELFFRGTLLAAMAAAVPTNGVNILGARITLAGLLISILFGLGHGVAFQEGGFVANWPIVAITGFLGFGLNWIRERTGSVLLAILAHNVINVSASFF